MLRADALSLTAVLLLPFASPAQDEAPQKEQIELVRLTGVYEDLAEQGSDLTALLTGGGAKPKPFYELIGRLEALAESSATTALFDLSGQFAFNLTQLPEVERAMAKVRAAGKQCHAYLEHASGPQYQVAALCDKVMMADLGVLDLPSLSLSVTFLRDAFDLLGIQTDVVRCGDFKGAVEPYLLSSMSDHLRNHYKAMLEQMNNDVAMRIAKARRLSVMQVREIQARRILTAGAAKDAGLVDVLVPWKGARHALETVLGRSDFDLHDAIGTKKRKSINIMQILSQMLNPSDAKEVEDETLVVLHLSGGIVDGDQPVAGSIVSGPAVREIRKLRDNDHVKGVVVRINSPGGSATASEAVLLALRDLAAKKPVAISMGRVAGSGGYYITCIGRPIFAEPGTITGSIGVFGMKTNLGPLMRRIGIHEELVALDDSAAMTSMQRAWTTEQKEVMQDFVNRIYDVFVGHVARSRKMTTSEVLAIAGGRVWSGVQAVENGLVDRIGGIGDALAVVAKDAGITGKYEVTHVPEPKDFMETIMQQMLDARVLFDGVRERLLVQRLGLDRALRIVVDSLGGERPGTVWAMMPEMLDIR